MPRNAVLATHQHSYWLDQLGPPPAISESLPRSAGCADRRFRLHGVERGDPDGARRPLDARGRRRGSRFRLQYAQRRADQHQRQAVADNTCGEVRRREGAHHPRRGPQCAAVDRGFRRQRGARLRLSPLRPLSRRPYPAALRGPGARRRGDAARRGHRELRGAAFAATRRTGHGHLFRRRGVPRTLFGSSGEIPPRAVAHRVGLGRRGGGALCRPVDREVRQWISRPDREGHGSSPRRDRGDQWLHRESRALDPAPRDPDR